MDLVFIPKLEYMAITRLAATICEHPDVHFFTINANALTDKREKTDRILNVIQQLPLPRLLEDEILIFAEVMCLEIQSWRERHRSILSSVFNRLIKFCWRSDGSIDSSRTAQALVRNENIHITTRFRLAACYFLEEAVRDLWNEIYYGGLSVSFQSLFRHETFFEDYWWFWYASGGTRELHDILENEIVHVPVFLLMLRNADANFRSFFEKLPMDRHLEWMRNFARENSLNRDLVLYCVTGPLRNQKLEVFRENPLQVLCIFLKWPLQSMFLDVAEHLWDNLGAANFLLVFIKICEYIVEERKNTDYVKLKLDFWYNSPVSCRVSVINRQREGDGQIVRANIAEHIPPLYRN